MEAITSHGFVKDIQMLTERSIVHDVGGKPFSTADLKPVFDQRKIEPILINNLKGLVDYIKTDIDKINKDECLVIVDDFDSVHLVSKIVEERKNRDVLVAVSLQREELNKFNFNRFIDHEEFIINLLSLFKQNEDRDRLLEYVSKLTLDNSVKVEDDGVAQSATIKTGISGALKESGKAPNFLKLIPWRTFREAEQPESNFLFRMKTAVNVPLCSLFEADGSCWKSDARKNIKKYLEDEKIGIPIVA